MNYAESIEYLNSFKKRGIKPGLDTTRSLLEATGFSHDCLKAVVCGTNGKGSTAMVLASILQAQGLKTGLYTSPHLIDFRERIRVDDCMIPKDEFAEIAGDIRDACEKKNLEPTFFEAVTVLALNHFMRSGVEAMVLEAGLGGRLDAVNAVDNDVAIVSSVGLEHTEILGDSIEAIAGEKAGVVEEGGILVTGEGDEAAFKAMRDHCMKVQAEIVDVNPMIRYFKEDVEAIKFTLETPVDAYRLESRLHGRYQSKNIACAVYASEVLGAEGDAIIKGVLDARVSGRLQFVQKNPRVLMDCAHNTQAFKALINYVKSLKYENLYFILGFSKDKDVDSMMELLPETDFLFAAESGNERAMDGDEIIRRYTGTSPSKSFRDVHSALTYALTLADEDDLIVVAGSIFLLGEAITYWRLTLEDYGYTECDS